MATGQKIGYIRVSTYNQNTDRQLESITLDKKFIDYASGKDRKRPELKAMLDYVREGDTILVHSMDRLARNVVDLKKIVGELTAKNIKVKFIKEGLEFTGDDSPMSNMLLSFLGAFAEFDLDFSRERHLEGVALAKKRGAYKGRKAALSSEQIEKVKQRIDNGEKITDIAKDIKVSRQTLYKYLKQMSLSG